MDLLKKLCKYFIITLAILFVCSFVVLVDKFHKIEYDVFDVLETYKALKYFLHTGSKRFYGFGSIQHRNCRPLFAFDKLKVQTWKEFVRKLAAGLLLVIPLSAMVYYCDWFVYPQMKKEYVRLKLEMTDNVPRDIDNNRTYHSYFNTIKNDMPMLLSKARLTYKLDSPEKRFRCRYGHLPYVPLHATRYDGSGSIQQISVGQHGSRTYPHIATDNKQGQPDIYTKKKSCCTNMQTRHGTRKQRYVNSPMNTVSGHATRQVCIYPISSPHLSYSCLDAITR